MSPSLSANRTFSGANAWNPLFDVVLPQGFAPGGGAEGQVPHEQAFAVFAAPKKSVPTGSLPGMTQRAAAGVLW